MTIVGQLSSPDRHHRGLYGESPPLGELSAEHLPAPKAIKLPIGSAYSLNVAIHFTA
jgi:hypothetical protein